MDTPTIKVLYIEDNVLSLRLLERAFRQTTYTLISAIDGFNGIQTALETLPDLIMIDMNLPDISGIEVAQRLRKDALFDNVPLVAFTADNHLSTRQRCMEVGFSAYLTKPLSRSLLLRTIRDTLYDLRQAQ